MSAKWKPRAKQAEALARDARRVLNERMEGARQEIADLRSALRKAEAKVRAVEAIKPRKYTHSQFEVTGYNQALQDVRDAIASVGEFG